MLNGIRDLTLSVDKFLKKKEEEEKMCGQETFKGLKRKVEIFYVPKIYLIQYRIICQS